MSRLILLITNAEDTLDRYKSTIWKYLKHSEEVLNPPPPDQHWSTSNHSWKYQLQIVKHTLKSTEITNASLHHHKYWSTIATWQVPKHHISPHHCAITSTESPYKLHHCTMTSTEAPYKLHHCTITSTEAAYKLTNSTLEISLKISYTSSETTLGKYITTLKNDRVSL